MFRPLAALPRLGIQEVQGCFQKTRVVPTVGAAARRWKVTLGAGAGPTPPSATATADAPPQRSLAYEAVAQAPQPQSAGYGWLDPATYTETQKVVDEATTLPGAVN